MLQKSSELVTILNLIFFIELTFLIFNNPYLRVCLTGLGFKFQRRSRLLPYVLSDISQTVHTNARMLHHIIYHASLLHFFLIHYSFIISFDTLKCECCYLHQRKCPYIQFIKTGVGWKC